MIRKKKKGRIVTGIMAAMLVMSFGTVCMANGSSNPYNFTQYAYEDYYDNVSDFARKDTYSSMYVLCGNSTDQFRVHALGSYGSGSGYEDCSGGYRYFIRQGESVDEMYNFVRENGYTKAGIKGEYQYDGYFHASGHFLADI